MGVLTFISVKKLIKCRGFIRCTLHRFGRSLRLSLAKLILLNIRDRPSVEGMDTFKLTLYSDLIAEPEVDVCLAEGKLYLVRTGLQCADRGIQHLSDFTQESIIAVRFAVDLSISIPPSAYLPYTNSMFAMYSLFTA